MSYKMYKNVRRISLIAFLTLTVVAISNLAVMAHPLGNFTVNHYSRLQINKDRIVIRFVVDMAEIPAFQTLQAIDTDNDGTPSEVELKAYAEQTAQRYADGLRLVIDGKPVALQTVTTNIETRPGNGGVPTLRLTCDFDVAVLAGAAAKRLVYEDANTSERAGWHEVVIAPAPGIAVFDSTAYGNGITDELQAYPEDRLAAPLDERRAELSFTAGVVPANAVALQTREGRAITPARDKFVELIAVPELTVSIALLGLLIAAGLGAVHAMSPGHGKTVVGAYLVGSRGTAKHAAFLGLTVTITHTLGVFALGLVTLFASEFILPEKLFPVINLISGVVVLFLGLSLFFKRLSSALGFAPPDHHHHHHHDHHAHSVEPEAAHAHSHASHNHLHHHHHSHGHAHTHTHSGHHVHTRSDELQVPDSGLRTHTHTHLPPGADGSPITWKSLLALGISGGLLPCPSALVVLLSAISMNRVGYGLLLVTAFSIGLAATLTAVGLLFLYAGRLLKRPAENSRWLQLLPVASALVIACIGAVICYQAVVANGFN